MAYVRLYIYDASFQICTLLIVSCLLHSLTSNFCQHPPYCKV